MHIEERRASMNNALILDDGVDSTVIMQLLLRYRRYDTTMCNGMEVCLQVLRTSRWPYVVCIGSNLEALAMFAVVGETVALQRHVYLLMMERGETLSSQEKRSVSDGFMLPIWRPLNMALTVRAIEFAGQMRR